MIDPGAIQQVKDAARVEEVVGSGPVARAEGLEIVRAEMPDLVALDVMLEEHDTGFRVAADIKVEAVEGLGYLQIDMDRRRMARMGISVAQVRTLIETAIGGRIVTTVPEGDRRTDVVVRLPREFTAKVENLRDLPLATPSGERVLLREVAEIVAALGNGRGLVYTDSDAELIGFVEIADPSAPVADGVVAVGGEPTSVAVAAVTSSSKYACAPPRFPEGWSPGTALTARLRRPRCSRTCTPVTHARCRSPG